MKTGINALEVLGIKFYQIIISLIILILFYLIGKCFRFLINFLLKRKLFNKSLSLINQILDNIKTPISYFILTLGVFIALKVLNLSKEVIIIVWRLFKVFYIIFFAWSLIQTINELIKQFILIQFKNNHSLVKLTPFISKCSKILVIAISLVLMMENLGYSTSSIIAAFGIGSAAIAFASQDTIANFFGSLSLVLDQPFQVGDRIRLGNDIDGFVESIGIRSTRIRTLLDSSLTIPNRVLANEKIDNWTNIKKRQVKQTISITYKATPKIIKNIVEDIRILLKKDLEIISDNIIVNFFDFRKSSFDILVIYYTNTIVWKDYLIIRERINLNIMNIIESYGNE